jgi:hypothetical protein
MDTAWETCTELELMLEELKDASPRKLRLFAVACCRQVASLLVDAEAFKALDVAEKYADGLANKTQLAQARSRARRTTGGGDAVDAVINATRPGARQSRPRRPPHGPPAGPAATPMWMVPSALPPWVNLTCSAKSSAIPTARYPSAPRQSHLWPTKSMSADGS